MARLVIRPAQAEKCVLRVPAGTDLVEWYFEQGWTDGLPVVSPTRALVDAFVEALGGDPQFVECKVPPRHGSLTREVLAINMVMAGCKPQYASVVRAAMLALSAKAFNLNGVQATTHMAAPLLVVNGPIAREIGMNGDCNAFGPGNRANATIGRALRLVLLNVGGGWPGDLDKSTLGHPGKYTYCVAENEAVSPWAPYHVEKGFSPDDSAVFVLAAEPPHSVTNHVANDPEGILDSICSAMSTIANNNAVSSGHCAVVIGPEHARTIAAKGWTRHDVRNYLALHAYNLFSEITFNERYGKIYNRNLPKWYKREPQARTPIVPGPDHIHLFVIGGDGTLRGGAAINSEIRKRNLKKSVIGVPKTIDNDIMYLDKSFGFETAFADAVKAVSCAHIEAVGAVNGIGLVKLMGRDSGFIACFAALAAQHVNFCLIPEVPFSLEGPRGLLEMVRHRIARRKHALVVVAEGAGQELMQTNGGEKDASGNRRLGDIGLFLKDKINDFFAERRMKISLKYIDPSYTIRSVPASPQDNFYCSRLAQNAVHAGMGGRTNMLIGRWHGSFVHIPFELAIKGRRKVDPDGDLWQAVLESTGQPAWMR